MIFMTIVVLRMVVAAILAGGAVYLAIDGRDAWVWIWFILAALLSGEISYREKK